MRELTIRQKEALAVINQYITENQYPPAFREIGAMMGIKSSSTICGYLNQLKKKGYINWEAGQPRTLRILITAS